MAKKLKKISGTTAADNLTGTTGDDSIDGGKAADTLVGGTGNDTYIVDNTGDAVTEIASEGTDTIQSSVSYSLSSNVENLTLTGKAAINATGNDLSNVLTGNAGNNTLTAGTGVATMIGGKGNDTYIINKTSDVITEASNAGTDTIQSSIAYTISTNVENLTLTGSSNINGTGNTLANTLTGNSGNNQLSGGDGNDTLISSSGSDTLIGGSGKDVFVFTDLTTSNSAHGVDYITSINTSEDKIDIDATHMAYLKSLNTKSGASGSVVHHDPTTVNVSSASSVDTIYHSLSGNISNGVAFVDVLNGSLKGYYVLLTDSNGVIDSNDALIGISVTSSPTSSLFM